MSEKPNYRVAFADVPEIVVKPHETNAENTAEFRARIVHGAETGVMLANRGPGYHTTPHMHDAEQFNYILSGEIWFFVEKNGYRCKAGDLMRIPKNRVHWAWNRGPGHAVVLETHAPPITANNQHNELIVSVLGPDEDRSKTTLTNVFPDFDQAEMKEIERRAIAAEMESAS
jgi:quercetin dioxygenase-like cupin family protein